MRRGDDLVARVVAWHNRNPLARRIGAAHVVSLGLVSFPFRVPPGDPAAARAAVEPDAPRAPGGEPADALRAGGEAGALPTDAAAPSEAGGSLRQRAEARARAQADAAADVAANESSSHGATGDAQPPRPAAAVSAGAKRAGPARGAAQAALRGRRRWQPAFDEDLLDPFPPRALARFALRHGVDRRPGTGDAPEREVALARGTARSGGAIVRLWVYAAAIDLGARRVRVLVAPPGPRTAVLGARLLAWDRGNLAAAFAGGAAAAVALAWSGGGLWPRPPGPTAAPLTAMPTLPGPAASTAAAAKPAPTPPPVAPEAASAVLATAPQPVPATPPSPPGEAATRARSAAAERLPQVAAAPMPPASSAAPAMPTDTLHHTPGHAPAHTAAQTPVQTPAQTPARTPRGLPELDESARQAARALGEMARADRARQLAERQRALGREGMAAAPSQAPRPPSMAALPLSARPGAQTSASTLPAASNPASPPTPPTSPPSPPPPTGASPPATAAAPRDGTGPSRTAAARAAAAPAGTAWAVSTRRLRTRFESEQMLAALRDVAYRGGHGSELKLEVLPSGDDWRAVGWPLATRAEAERLREALAARGLKLEVVQF